jgi:hypothetical protein
MAPPGTAASSFLRSVAGPHMPVTLDKEVDVKEFLKNFPSLL